MLTGVGRHFPKPRAGIGAEGNESQACHEEESAHAAAGTDRKFQRGDGATRAGSGCISQLAFPSCTTAGSSLGRQPNPQPGKAPTEPTTGSRANHRLGLLGGYQGRARRGLGGHRLQVGSKRLCSVQYQRLWTSTGVAPALPCTAGCCWDLQLGAFPEGTFSLVLSQKGLSAQCFCRKPCRAFCKLPLANTTLLDLAVTLHRGWNDQMSPTQAGSEAHPVLGVSLGSLAYC